MSRLLTRHGMRVIALRTALKTMLEEVDVCRKEADDEEGEVLAKLAKEANKLECYIDEFEKMRDSFSDKGY